MNLKDSEECAYGFNELSLWRLSGETEENHEKPLPS